MLDTSMSFICVIITYVGVEGVLNRHFNVGGLSSNSEILFSLLQLPIFQNPVVSILFFNSHQNEML